VVTDVVMPDENVFDVLPRIRKERPKLPIIVMSAQNNLITAVTPPMPAPSTMCRNPSTSTT